MIETSSSLGCSTYMFNSGWIELTNSTEYIVKNGTIKYSAWLIKCDTLKDYQVVQSILNSNLSIVNEFIHIDNFSNGNLVIALMLCGISVASGMLFLILLLLPSNTHNNRKRLVYIYVAYYAIIHFILLERTSSNVFKHQYNNNIQDSTEFHDNILNSTWAKTLLLIAEILCDLNWMEIIYYMYHNYHEIRKRWLPHFLADINKRIIVIGLLLTILHSTFYGLQLFYHPIKHHVSFSPSMFLDLFDYACFASIVLYYLYHNFGHTFSYNKDLKDESWINKLKYFWRNYHSTILLLIYNLTIFIILCACSILSIISYNDCSNWIISLIGFWKVLIIVSIWGLIGHLERRERILSKGTVLGRKINNEDRFFKFKTNF